VREMTVSVSGLSNLDRLEVGSQSGVEFEEQPIPPGAQGELTIFTAYFAMSALRVLAAYLMRKHDGASFEETVTISHPDGRREERHIKWQRSNTAPPEAELIRQIRGTVI
jgi:hypothetical protein